MKIGIITFHWATNYGAVLQSFALQTYLETLGYEVEIINYVPFRNKVVSAITRFLKRDFSYFKREHRISKFRKKYLHLSKKYSFQNSLKKIKQRYQFAIAGSDQIWNVSFTLQKGKKPNLSYFLSFVSDETIRISYAASFGSIKVPEDYVCLVKQELNKFNYISVREKSGVSIINDIGFEAQLVCDPTFLLETKFYNELIFNNNSADSELFSFILHNDSNGMAIVSSVLGLTKFKHCSKETYSVSEWLSHIKNSSIVVTNSFHCIVYSLLFNKPFIAVGIKGSGMNDRLVTLLKTYGLDNRFIINNDEELIKKALNSPIDWDSVNETTKLMQAEGKSFLNKALTNSN